MTGRPFRLAYLVSHPIQYQAPLLRYLAAQPEIDLTVFFLSRLSLMGYQDGGFQRRVVWDVPLVDGYRHVFLPCWGRDDQLSFWSPWTRRVAQHLGAGFDALWIHGYGHQALLRALWSASRRGIRLLLRGESHLESHERSRARNTLKQACLRRLFRRVDGFLAIGSLNREYYTHYGVPDQRIFDMPYAVDNTSWQRRAAEARRQREGFRACLGLTPGRPIILFAAKLIPRKRPGDLVEAYVRLSSDGHREPAPYLLFVGDGQQRPALQARVAELGWSSIRFLGFKNQSEMPAFYDLCDVFVLPSEREPWGLVLNEVMNFSKPILASDRVGAARDLLRDGENGLLIPVGNIPALSLALRRLLENAPLAQSMGERSLNLIQDVSFEHDRDGLLKALDAAVGRRSFHA